MSSPPSKPTARVADAADSLPLPRPRALFARALRLRCPVCGGGPVLLSWFTIATSCPSCGFHLDRDEPGYWIGSYTVNLFVTEGIFAAAFVGGMLITWPAVPWTLLGILCAMLAILTPVAAFPHSKLIYLAIDLAFRPVDPDDLTTPLEKGVATAVTAPRSTRSSLPPPAPSDN